MSRIEQIRKLLEDKPQDVFLNYSLAVEHQSAGRIDEAIAQFDRTIALDAGYVAAYVKKGEALMASERFDEARRCLANAEAAALRAGDQHTVDNIRDMMAMLD